MSENDISQNFRVIFDNGFSGWCRLCERLQDENLILENRKFYKNANENWQAAGVCNNSIGMKYLI